MLVRQCLHTSNFDFYRLDSRNFLDLKIFNALVRATHISTD